MRIVARLLVLLPLLFTRGGLATPCWENSLDLNTSDQVNTSAAEVCDKNQGHLQVYNSNSPILENPTNHPPTAVDVYASSLISTVSVPQSATVVLEGADAEFANLTYSVVTAPTNGTLSDPEAGDISIASGVIAGQTLIYTPANDFTGTDAFTYKVSDGSRDSDARTAMITVFGGIRAHAKQIGTDIYGKQGYQWGECLGASLSLSGDGQTIAIGGPCNSDNGTNFGQVRVYKFSGGDWIRLGSEIDAITSERSLGSSVSLSSDGQTLAIGAPAGAGGRGEARVYKLSGDDWIQLGTEIQGSADGDRLGESVSLSSDGQTLAIGAPPLFDAGPQAAGYARVYRFNGSDWMQLGTDIYGEGAGDHFGFSVSLSSGGEILAIGAPSNDYHPIPEFNGGPSKVRVYNFNGSDWIQLGADIQGSTPPPVSYAGYSTCLSSDGKTLAFGAPYNSENGAFSGKVQVYFYDDGDWTQLGDDIFGERAHDSAGDSVALSADGRTLAVGGYFTGVSDADSGEVRVYKFTGGSWIKLVADIEAQSLMEFSGASVSLSSNGQTLAIGVPSKRDNGQKIGQARIFELKTSAPVISGTPIATAYVGATYSFSPDSSDTDLADYNLNFSVTVNGGLPGWLSIDTATGELSGVPEVSDVGILNDIVITVSDGDLSSSLGAFNLAVVAPVVPSIPTITSTHFGDGKIILTVSLSDNGGTDITGYEATCTDGTNTYTGTSTTSPVTVSGLTNGVAYTCTVTATNSVGTSSSSAATDPITPEEAPTGLPIWLLYQATQ